MPSLCRVDWFYWVQLLKAPSTVLEGSADVLVLTVSALRAQRSKLGWYFWGLTIPAWVTLQHYNHQWESDSLQHSSPQNFMFLTSTVFERSCWSLRTVPWHSLSLTHNPLHWWGGASLADLGTAPAHLSPGEMYWNRKEAKAAIIWSE